MFSTTKKPGYIIMPISFACHNSNVPVMVLYLHMYTVVKRERKFELHSLFKILVSALILRIFFQ